MKTLALASPHMKNQTVKDAQNLLKHNKFHQDYLQGDADGEFGPETARACKRAKYWLGFASDNQVGNYGKFLHMYLSGERLLTKEMKARRELRLKKMADTPLRIKALNEIRKDIGMKEHPPNSNHCETSEWWGFDGAWCAMEVSRAYIRAGSKAFRRGANWAYVPYLITAAVQGVNGLSLTRYPKIGDIVCYDWDDDGVADHTGLIASVIGSNGNFEAIEGNTAVGNDSNGGECMVRSRNTSDVATRNGQKAFIHVSK